MDIVIMAGGRARRLGGMEKGLLPFLGRTLLEIAVEAAVSSGVGPVLVAVSPHTPRTADLARSRGLQIVRTPGRGYHQDVVGLLQDRCPFMTVSVDLPFLRGDHLAALARAYGSRSLAGALPRRLVPSDVTVEGIRDEEWRGKVPVGVNVVDRCDTTDIFLFDDPLLAYNVNTWDDLRRAERRARSLRRLQGRSR